jgi:hypothetical protein
MTCQRTGSRGRCRDSLVRRRDPASPGCRAVAPAKHRLHPRRRSWRQRSRRLRTEGASNAPSRSAGGRGSEVHDGVRRVADGICRTTRIRKAVRPAQCAMASGSSSSTTTTSVWSCSISTRMSAKCGISRRRGRPQRPRCATAPRLAHVRGRPGKYSESLRRPRSL